MATKDAIKLSLGEDLYLTHTTFNNMDRIHIRKFISMPSLFDSKKTFQRPTKDGVSLKLEQARRLDSLLPLIVNELQSGNPQEVVPVLLAVGVTVGHEGGHQGLQVDPPQLHVPLQGGGSQTCQHSLSLSFPTRLIPSASRK